jgi:hypothetical protein
MPTKRTPPEPILKELVEQARDDEMVEELASKSDAELDQELAAAGIDVEKERAEAQAFRRKLEKSAAERRAKLAAKAQADAAKPATDNEGSGVRGSLADAQRRMPRPLRRGPLAAFIAAGVTAAAAGGIIVSQIRPPPVTDPPPSPAEIRRDGVEACKSRNWQQCLEKLDFARDLDPSGDRAPEVQAARRAAHEALRPNK